jgi:hypothetical protein
MAGTTGLEPATSDVTGRRSNQLSYVPFVADTSGHSKDITPGVRAAYEILSLSL